MKPHEGFYIMDERWGGYLAATLTDRQNMSLFESGPCFKNMGHWIAAQQNFAQEASSSQRPIRQDRGG